MSILRYGIVSQTAVVPLIETDVASVIADWPSLAYTDYIAITVSLALMDTTITLVDTGDGTAFATINPENGTGSYSFRARSASANQTGVERSMIARISDDATEASSVDVTIYQTFEPA